MLHVNTLLKKVCISYTFMILNAWDNQELELYFQNSHLNDFPKKHKNFNSEYPQQKL